LRPLGCAMVQLLFLIQFRAYVNNLLILFVFILASLGLFAVLAVYGAISRDERLALFRLIFRN
jgi:hypothetical protein